MGSAKRPSSGSDSESLFGDVLRKLRRAAGLTQEELAGRARLSQRGLSDLERGVNRHPRRHTVLALADALHLSADSRAQLIAAARRRGADVVVSVTTTPPQAAARDRASEFASASVRPPVQSDERHAPVAVQIFMIADIRGYTRYTYEHGDEDAARLAIRFATIAEETVVARGGQVLELRGDEVMAVFTSVRAALHAAVDLQRRLGEVSQETPTDAMYCGVGLDAGEAVPVAGGYRGLALNLAARLCSHAAPGEVLASETIIGLARKVEGISYRDRGMTSFKGFATPVRVIQILPADVSAAAAIPVAPEASPPQPAFTAGPEALNPPIGGFLGAQPEHQLVARAREIGALYAAVDAVRAGAGRLVFLVGESGVGKTRLAQEVTMAARSLGFLVATGRCYAPQENVPYFPFLEALSRAYLGISPALRAALPQEWPEVARLLPEFRIHQPKTYGDAVSGGYDDQQRLFWHVTGFLQAAAAERPFALLLDDMHWADGTSLALLMHLTRHTRDHRVLIVCTYRDVDAQPVRPVVTSVRDLSREHLVERIEVRRLSKEGTAALLTGMLEEGEVSDEVAALIHEPTDGNAFFVQEVLRALIERGDVTLVEGRWERREGGVLVVPEDVRMAILERVSRLSSVAQQTLSVASVLGQTFTFDDLLAMRSIVMQHTDQHTDFASPDDSEREAELDAVLEELVAARLLREAEGESYTFSHGLAQHALYDELSSHRRRRLHLAAGEAIERLQPRQLNQRVAEVAYHFLRADKPARALPYALQAAAHAEQVFANEEAIRHYEEATRLAREIGDQAREGESLERLGMLYWGNLGDYRITIKTHEQAVQVYRSVGNQEAEVRAAAQLARAYVRCSEPAAARGLLSPYVESLVDDIDTARESTERPKSQAVVLSALADVHFHQGEYREQAATATRAAELWQMLGDAPALLDALDLRAVGLRLLGQWQDAANELQRVVELGEESEQTGALYPCAHALYHLGYSYVQSGQFDLAAMTLEHGQRLGERTGNIFFRGSAQFVRGIQSFHAGDWTAAQTCFDEVTRLIHGISLTTSVYSPFGQGIMRVATGERDLGMKLLHEALTLAEHSEFVFGQDRILRELAEVELVMGNATTAQELLEPKLADPDRSADNDATPMMPMLAWAHIERGGVQDAAALLERAAVQAKVQHHRIALLDVQRVRGMLHLKQQRWPEAEEALDHGLALARSMPHPYAEAKTLYVAGQLQAEMGHAERAHEHFTRALSICDRLGEGLYRPLIERAYWAQ